jgi:hypothetical protein
MDINALDHMTSDLERLHVHEHYGGKDQVQVAKGPGLSTLQMYEFSQFFSLLEHYLPCSTH